MRIRARVWSKGSRLGRDGTDLRKFESSRVHLTSMNLEECVVDLLDNHPEKVEEYLDGNDSVLGYFVYCILQELGGGQPEHVRAELKHQIEQKFVC